MDFCGVFATHQHSIFLSELRLFPSDGCEAPQLRRTVLWRMAVSRAVPPTAADTCTDGSAAQMGAILPHDVCYTVEPGLDTTSLAIEVAQQEVCSPRQLTGTYVFVPACCACMMHQPSCSAAVITSLFVC
jgi:hypothetical protein